MTRVVVGGVYDKARTSWCNARKDALARDQKCQRRVVQPDIEDGQVGVAVLMMSQKVSDGVTGRLSLFRIVWNTVEMAIMHSVRRLPKPMHYRIYAISDTGT